MKIAHFPGSFLPIIGGAEFSIHNIAKHQVLAGHEVTVLVSDAGALELQKKYSDDIAYKIHVLKPKTLGLVKAAIDKGLSFNMHLTSQLKKLQGLHGFDVWHFNLATYQALGAISFLKKAGLPVVITCRGADIQRLPEVGYGLRLQKRFNKAFEKIIPQGTWFTGISNSVREEYLQMGISDEIISVIPNGLEVATIKGVDVDKEEFRQAVNWPLDKKIIVTVGRNHPKKGYIYIPDIINELQQKRQDFLWVIVGRGCENVQAKAQELGVLKYMLFMDELGIKENSNSRLSLPTENLIQAYKSADLFAFPTLMETFGNVQIESMAAGIPCITTDATGARDIVRHEFNGMVSKVKDNEGMAENIHRVLADPVLYDTLVKNGLEDCENYLWTDVVDQYCRAYEKAIDRVNNK